MARMAGGRCRGVEDDVECEGEGEDMERHATGFAGAAACGHAESSGCSIVHSVVHSARLPLGATLAEALFAARAAVG